MFCFPQIPLTVLFSDVLKGERRQLYLDSQGEHQYYKRLRNLRAAQDRRAELMKEYKRKRQGNYNPMKLTYYIHTALMYEFGFSLEWWDHYFETN